MRRVTACFLALLGAALAHAQTVSVPDERVSVTVSPEQSGNGGRLGVRGNLGAFGFDNSIEGAFQSDQSFLRFNNPPLNGALEVSRSGGQKYDESFGPPIARATIGTAGITAGFDQAGRLTGLGWPGPGTYDHVNYIQVTRGYPNKGAPENAGSFGGIVGASGWGADGGWLTPRFGWRTTSQQYASDTTETLVTVLANDALGLEVTITDVVDPVEDLIARNFRFSAPPPGGFVYYANMNPTTSRVPRVPSVTDGAADNFSDFGTVYDGQASVMLHFRPYKIDPAALTVAATSQPGYVSPEDVVSGAFGPGVYVAVAGQSPASELQAGVQSGGLVRSEAEGTTLLDPYWDIADGHLSGSTAAYGKTAGALRVPADDASTSFTVYLAAASSAADAVDTIEDARARGFESIRAAADDWWSDWISRARLPATDDAETLAVARRALMLVRTAQDRETGAIVANATTQTPYRQDWVRDGAFFNYALLLAGYPEMAIQHSEFYRGIYRAGGTWDSFYYPDGAEAGFVFPFEIDSQAFALWALWLPYEFDPTRLGYLAGVYPPIRDTANALLLCQDPVTGLQCYGAKDDAVIPSQGAQGAATVYLALRAATAAAVALGVDADQRGLWTMRTDRLREATLANLCSATGCQGGRGGVYLAWPSRLLEGRPELQPHLGQFVEELDRRASFAEPAVGGFFQYPMESLLALAPYWQDANKFARLDGWVRWLTHEVVEPGVLHYGERIFRCDFASPCEAERRYLHSIGFPHIWSGTEMYIAAAFVYGVSGGAVHYPEAETAGD